MNIEKFDLLNQNEVEVTIASAGSRMAAYLIYITKIFNKRAYYTFQQLIFLTIFRISIIILLLFQY